MAVRARLPSLAHRYVREPPQAQQLQGERQKAVYQTGLPGVRAQMAAPPQVLPAFQPAPDDEWASQQAQSLRVQQASQPAAPLPVQELALWVRPSVLQARSALPRAQREPRAVSPPSAQCSLAEAPRQASSAQLWQPLPSLLFLLWQPLPLALLLRQRPESFCAPSQRRPRESSSSASSFP